MDEILPITKPSFKLSLHESIPNDWSIKFLGDIGVFSKGKGILKEQVISEGYPCIRYGEMYTSYDYLITECRSFISNEVANESQEIKHNDILFAGSGETIEEIGKSAAYIGHKKAYAGGDLIILSPDIDTNAECLSYALETDFVRKQKRRYGQGQQVVHIYSSDLANVKVPLPPLPEQQKIASILSTWDEAISKTQQLITQLKERNRSLQQQLLKGKIRINGFTGNLNAIPIRDFAKELSAKNRNNDDLIVLSCTKYKGLVSSLEYFGKQIFSKDISTYKVVPQGCFAYATNHIEEGSIGLQTNYDDALISPMYTVFKTNASVVDNSYLYKVLKSHNYILEYKKRMEGSIDRRGGLRWDEFSKIRVSLPSIDEQREISKVIDFAYHEIQVQEQKLETLKLQKKGLMQKLLTGQIRVLPH